MAEPAQYPVSGSRRVALVATSAEDVAGILSSLIRDIIGRGHRVVCVTPEAPAATIRAIRALGATHRIVDLTPPGLPLYSDFKSVSALLALLKDWQPELVVGAGLKAMISAAIAGRRAGAARVVGLLTGMPSQALEDIGTRRIAHGLKASDAVVAYCEDYVGRLEAAGALPQGVERVVVAGAGVDVRHHRALPLPPLDQGVVFLMTGCRAESRGAAQYEAAARWLKDQGRPGRFLVDFPAGYDETSTGALEPIDPEWSAEEALGACHVFVFPSDGEETLQPVLHALAAGRPVITSDIPGFRDAVDEKVSGCHVPVGDAATLARAMESFIHRPDLLAFMAKAARVKAERRFDEQGINQALLAVLRL